MATQVKILLVGDTGYLGTSLTESLANQWAICRNSELPIQDRLSSKQTKSKHKEVLVSYNIDVVIFLAALDQKTCEFIDPYEVNVAWPLTLAEAIIETNRARGIFFSSIHVFRKDLDFLYSECVRSEDIATNPYGQSKGQMEIILHKLLGSSASNRRIHILRLSNVFGLIWSGANRGGKLAINSFIVAKKKNQTLEIYNKNSVRSILPITILVESIKQIIEGGKYDFLMNVGSRDFYLIYDIYRYIFEGISIVPYSESKKKYQQHWGIPEVTPIGIMANLNYEMFP